MNRQAKGESRHSPTSYMHTFKTVCHSLHTANKAIQNPLPIRLAFYGWQNYKRALECTQYKRPTVTHTGEGRGGEGRGGEGRGEGGLSHTQYVDHTTLLLSHIVNLTMG